MAAGGREGGKEERREERQVERGREGKGVGAGWVRVSAALMALRWRDPGRVQGRRGSNLPREDGCQGGLNYLGCV